MKPIATTIQIDKRTSVIALLKRLEIDDNQLDLFSDYKTIWMDSAQSLALKLATPFFFSDLRAIIKYEPPHCNWWGALTHKLKKLGFRQTGRYRKSPKQSRKGGLDAEWTR